MVVENYPIPQSGILHCKFWQFRHFSQLPQRRSQPVSRSPTPQHATTSSVCFSAELVITVLGLDTLEVLVGSQEKLHQRFSRWNVLAFGESGPGVPLVAKSICKFSKKRVEKLNDTFGPILIGQLIQLSNRSDFSSITPPAHRLGDIVDSVSGPDESLLPRIIVASRKSMERAIMIQPLNTTQLSSAKPRGGLQSVSELLPRLIELYEVQANARRQIEEDNLRRQAIRQAMSNGGTSQTTFAWYQ